GGAACGHAVLRPRAGLIAWSPAYERRRRPAAGGASVVDLASRKGGALGKVAGGAGSPPPRGSSLSRVSLYLFQLPLPPDNFGKAPEFLRLHVHRVLRPGIGPAAHVLHVSADHVLHDRDEIRVDLRVTWGVLLIE